MILCKDYDRCQGQYCNHPDYKANCDLYRLYKNSIQREVEAFTDIGGIEKVLKDKEENKND